MIDLSIIQFALLALVTFFAAMTQSITGFGFALLTLPFYVLILDLQSAVQLTLISTFIITIILVPVVYKNAPLQTCKQLIQGSCFGFPLGFILLNYATTTSIQIFVSVVIFSAIFIPFFLKKQLSSNSENIKSSALKTGLYGFVSGMMTTSIAMPGPALAFYAQNNSLGKQETRAMIFMVFLFSYGTAILLQLFMNGIFETTRGSLVYVLIPAIFGTLFGNKISGKIPDKIFRKFVNLILILTATYLLLSNMIKLLG